MPSLRTVRGALAAFLLLAGAAGVRAQTQEAVRTRYQSPVYPENLAKALRQGNVLLAGRIDTQGRVSDLHLVAASAKDFVQPAAEAVQGWQFRPAMRDGKPVEVFLNVGVRFRMEGEKRGDLEAPILGDVAISPADASGRKSAPEGFPIRRGQDPALRAEALLDIPPSAEGRTLTVKVEAVSPKGKRVPVFQPPVAVPAKATEVRFPVVARIGPDWEDGVWMLRFMVNGAGVGGGQFWLAADPSKFSFVIPTSPQ
ncbi:MAG: energy transducer TonB [Thermoanaerobaculia bacterium]